MVFSLSGKVFFRKLTTLVDIMLLGRWIEMKSVMGASKEALAKLIPPDAHKLMPDGSVKDVPLGELAVNNKVLIKPGEKIPADGVIVDGEGSLTIEVKGTSKDSFLLQVINLIKLTQESKSKMQNIADTAAMWLPLISNWALIENLTAIAEMA